MVLHMLSPLPAQDDVVRCIECDRVADGTAEGWEAYVCGGYEGEPIEVLVYCPVCADRESGHSAVAQSLSCRRLRWTSTP